MKKKSVESSFFEQGSFVKMTSGFAVRIPRGPLSKKDKDEVDREVKRESKQSERGFIAGFNKASVKSLILDEE